ncbi:OLC1v1015799C1 [Oldenlandia corymbosa var. corymbosa]|uniref:OLC1v1015799C1 n=1 Tax=Oldenlandia corymbosa var. corymbosa TaxID=529605 RepID=A0AAV1E6X0_OLDCO|nr:OLC1v1015799C1 [Oldenlandia corymbosa var. corymbosa]
MSSGNPRKSLSRGIDSGEVGIDESPKMLSQILGVPVARKIEWSGKNKAEQSKGDLGWQGFNPSKMKKAGAKLEFIAPIEQEGKKVAQMKSPDVKAESEYWEQSLVSFVLVANPPLPVMNRFYSSLWKNDVDKLRSLSRQPKKVQKGEAVVVESEEDDPVQEVENFIRQQHVAEENQQLLDINQSTFQVLALDDEAGPIKTAMESQIEVDTDKPPDPASPGENLFIMEER